MEMKRYLSDILLTVLLSWKATLCRLRDFHDTERVPVTFFVTCGVKLQLPSVLIYYFVPLQGKTTSKHVAHGLHFIGQGTGCLKIHASTQQLRICADNTGSTQKKEVTPLNPQKYELLRCPGIA